MEHLGWHPKHPFKMPSRFTVKDDVKELMEHYNLLREAEEKVPQALAALGWINTGAAPAPPPPSATTTEDRTATDDEAAGAAGRGDPAGGSAAAGAASLGSGEVGQGARQAVERRVTWGTMEALTARPAEAAAPPVAAAAAAAERDAAGMVQRGEAELTATLNAFTPSMAAVAMEEDPAPPAGAGGSASRSGGGGAAGAAPGRGEKRKPGRPSKADMEARQARQQELEGDKSEMEEARKSKQGRVIIPNSRFTN